MDVILVKDVPNVGNRGDIVNVSRGYAVNYLVAKKLGKIASEQSIKIAKEQMLQRKQKVVEAGVFADKLVRTVTGKTVQIKAKTSKSGRLYGSLDGEEVCAELGKVWKIEGKDVTLEVSLGQPVRETGKYPIEVGITGKGKKRLVPVVLSIVGE